MAFEIFLSRTYVPGFGQRLSGDLRALTRDDFELIMDRAPIRRRLEDGTYWLWHPEGMAWLSASFHQGAEEDESYISLRISYGHNQFLKVWADAFELALRFAARLNARIIEDSSYLEITTKNAGEILSARGKLVLEQLEFWKKTVAGIDARGQAPLEYPLGPYDAVNDYFVFLLKGCRKENLSSLASSLNLSIAPESSSANTFALQDRKSGSILSRVLQRPDGILQIRPFYWLEQFSVFARETLSLALLLRKELQGKLFLQEMELDDSLECMLKEHIDGLGVEFFLWLNELRAN